MLTRKKTIDSDYLCSLYFFFHWKKKTDCRAVIFFISVLNECQYWVSILSTNTALFRFRYSLPSNDIDTLKTAKTLSLKNGNGLTICRILVNSESRKRYRGKYPCIVFRQQGKQGRGSWLELRRRISLLLCSCSTNLRAACWKKDKDCGRTIKNGAS